MHYAHEAAERALQQLAPDEAARWYRQALELQGQAPAPDRSERCELLIGLGEAQRQVGDPEFRRTLLDAAALAQQLNDTGRLCRAVLANSRGYVSQLGTVDSERVHALETAARTVPRDDPRQGQVLALLASELHHAGEPERCQTLAAEAVRIARSAGDQAALAHTLQSAFMATWVPDTLQQRRQLTGELVELTRRLDDPSLSYWAATASTISGMEAGDRSAVESGLATMRTVTASVPDPAMAWEHMSKESGWAFIRGDLRAAEQWAVRAFEIGRASGQPDAVMVFGGGMFNVRYFQGRAGELLERLVRLAGKPDMLAHVRAEAALALIESDRADEARELALAEDFQILPWDFQWSTVVWPWADACSSLGLADRAAELYELLAPFAGQIACVGGVNFGSIDWALGALATTLERYEQAESHFTAAAALEQRLGAPLLLARTRARWARALIARGRTEDLGRARCMLEQAEKVAGRLGGALVSEEITHTRANLAAISS
jgi:tetratricopeptide (TPR) repeat protein